MSDRMPALRIAVAYGVVSVLWILFSDFFINLLTDDPNLLSKLQTYKGLGFIMVTTLGIYSLALSQTQAIRKRQREADRHAVIQEALASLGQKALSVTSLEQLYQHSLSSVAETLAVDLVKITRLDPDTSDATVIGGRGWDRHDTAELQIPTGRDSLAKFVLESERPVHILKLSSENRFQIPEHLLEEGIVSSLLVTFSNHELKGILGVHQRSRRSFDRVEENFLVTAANIIAQAIENQEAEADIRLQSELLGSVGQAVIATDPEGKIFYWNSAAEQIYGWSAAEAIGRNVVELTPALGQDTRAAAIMQQMQAGSSWEGEFRLRRKDGSEFVALVRNNVIRDEQHEITANVSVTTDITRIKEAQLELQRSTERLQLLHMIDQSILGRQGIGKIVSSVLDSLHEIVPFDLGSIVVLNRQEYTAQSIASFGEPNPLPAGKRVGWAELGLPLNEEADWEPYVYSPNLKLLKEPDEIVADLIQQGMRTALVVMLMTDGEAVGALRLSTKEVKGFTDDDIETCQQVADSLAVGLQSAEFRATEQRRAQELEALQRSSLAITSELELEELLASTVSLAYDLFQSDNAFIYLLESDQLAYAAGRWNPDFYDKPYANPRPNGLSYKVARSGEPELISSVKGDPLFAEDYPEWDGAIASHPLKFRGTVLGVLNLGFNSPQHFSPTDKLVIELLTDMAAVAIHNARQYQDISRRRAESEALFRVSQRLAGEYQLHDVLDAIVYSIIEAVEGAEASSLWLMGPEDERLKPQAWYGHADSDMKDLFVERGQSAAGYVVEQGLPLMVTDTAESVRFEPVGEEALDAVKSLIGVPIWEGTEVIGALFADSFTAKSAFSQHDFRMLNLLAGQASTVILRARLFDQVQTSRENLQELSRRLVQVQEEERRGLARELHDELGQLATGLKLSLEMSQDQLEQGEKPELAPIIRLAEELLVEVRDLSLKLRPSMLDDLGLLPTLLWLVDRTHSHMGVEVHFTHEGIEDRSFESEIETTAYRVAQESLTNVARHAKVQEAWLEVWIEGQVLVLQIFDEGVGFNPEEIKEVRSATGLSGMTERAQLLGGELAIESSPGEGTILRLRLPMEGHLKPRRTER